MNEQAIIDIQRRRLMHTYCRAFAIGWLYNEGQRRPDVSIYSLSPYLPWPEERDRKPAMNYVKDGQVMFGPPVPDGNDELVVQVVRRRGKKLRVKVLRDGRETGSQVGCVEDWHADNNLVFFGMPRRGEKKKVVEPLLASLEQPERLTK